MIIKHRIRNRPSGLLPSDLDRPLGSLVTGMPADPNARATSSFLPFCQKLVCKRSCVCRMHLPVHHTDTDVARISASPDEYRPRLERLHHRAGGRRRLSVGQKASHHCVRRRLPKRKPAEEVSLFVIPLTLIIIIIIIIIIKTQKSTNVVEPHIGVNHFVLLILARRTHILSLY